MSERTFNKQNEEMIVMGKNVSVRPFTTIGFLPHGFEKDNKFKVILKDDVYIGSNCSIDRGIRRHTIIEKGTMIGNLVCIESDVHIGKECNILNCAAIGAGCEIGNMCTIGINATIRPGTEIPDHTIIEDGFPG